MYGTPSLRSRTGATRGRPASSDGNRDLLHVGLSRHRHGASHRTHKKGGVRWPRHGRLPRSGGGQDARVGPRRGGLACRGPLRGVPWAAVRGLSGRVYGRGRECGRGMPGRAGAGGRGQAGVGVGGVAGRRGRVGRVRNSGIHRREARAGQAGLAGGGVAGLRVRGGGKGCRRREGGLDGVVGDVYEWGGGGVAANLRSALEQLTAMSKAPRTCHIRHAPRTARESGGLGGEGRVWGRCVCGVWEGGGRKRAVLVGPGGERTQGQRRLTSGQQRHQPRRGSSPL